jgi:hypothetical protein
MRPSSSIAVGTDAVRGIVPSLDGREAVVVLGENRRYFSPSVRGAALLRIEGERLALGEAPPFATETMFALGAGEVAAARVEYNEVALLRPAGATPLIRGMSLLDVAMKLAPDGGEFRVRATERDDGHGWTEPVYTRYAFRVALDGSTRVAAPWFRALRGAGSPALAPMDGHDDDALDRVLDYLPYPFNQERAVCLGPRLLVTAARVIDVRSGETLIGQSSIGHNPPRDFFDLSADETRAVAADADETLALWDVARRTARRIPEVGETRCAAFVGDRLLVGGADGRVHLLS